MKIYLQKFEAFLNWTYLAILESSKAFIKSSTVQNEDSKTQSKGQTSEVVEKEGDSAPKKKTC